MHPTGKKKSAVSYSFIVPSYNSARTISRTIVSIVCQSRTDLIREIIVIDSSEDGQTRKLINEAAHPLIKKVFSEKKLSPAQGRNRGAAIAQGDYLCFVDSDVVLDSSWLENVHRAVLNGIRSGCGAVGVAEEQKFNMLALGQWYLQFNEYLECAGKKIVRVAPACNLFCQKLIFESAGGFPLIRASEDSLFCLKIGKITPVWVIPQARCEHVFRQQWSAFARNQHMLGKYVIVYRRRFYGKWFYRSFWPLVLSPVFVLIKFSRIPVRVLNGGYRHCALFLLSLPVFIAGCLYWTCGLLSGALSADNA